MKQQLNYLEDHHKSPVFFQAQGGESVSVSDTDSLAPGIL